MSIVFYVYRLVNCHQIGLIAQGKSPGGEALVLILTICAAEKVVMLHNFGLCDYGKQSSFHSKIVL